MEDLKTSLEYDWDNFSSELSDFILDDDYEDMFDFEEYLHEEFSTKKVKPERTQHNSFWFY